MSTDSDPPTDELKEAFPRVAELERRLREADIDLGDLPQKEGITRRDLVKAAGVAGVAGLAGAGGMNAATDTASAGTQSTGTIGTAANPVDVEAEDINATAINADSSEIGSLVGAFPGKVRAIAGGEVTASIDPSTTTTPIQDAVDAALAAATSSDETLILVPDGITEAASVNVKGTYIKGLYQRTTVNFSSSGATTDHGFIMDSHWSTLENIQVDGPGSALTTGYGIYINGAYRRVDLRGEVNVLGWGNPGIYSDAKPFEMNWGTINVTDCNGHGIHFSDLGPANHADLIKVKVDFSGVNAYRQRNGEMNVNTMQLSGAPDTTPVFCDSGAGGVSVGRINFEPDVLNLIEAVVELGQGGSSRIETIWLHRGDPDYAYKLNFQPKNHYLGRVRQSVAPNVNVVSVASDPIGEVLFEGDGAEVTNNTGAALSNPISCLGDQTLVT